VAGEINIPIAGDASKFIRETSDAEKALDKVADALDDAAKESKEAGRDGERSFRDLTSEVKDTERATDKLADSFDDARKKARDVGDDGERSLRRLGVKGSEVGGELKQNLGETFSSFRGDLEDLPQIAQDTLGGLAGSGALGGIAGLAATAAGAAGLGLVIGAMETIEERNKALEARANELAQAYISAGTNILSAMDVASASSAVLTDPEKRKEVQAYADALGIDLPTAVRAYVGDANAMAVVDKVAADAKAENRRMADEQRESLKALTPEQQKAIEANMGAIGAQRELTGVVSDANATFRNQQQVLMGLINDAEGATKEVDELGNAVYSLPDGTQIMIDAETSQATTDVSRFKGDVDGIKDTVTTTVKVAVDSSAWDKWSPPMKRALISYSAVAADKKGLDWQ
jgi:hypothetical protein